MGHLTLETIQALKDSQVVFSHSLEGGPAGTFIRGFCGDFRPLVGKSPKAIVSAVQKAFKTRETAAFLTYGNPLFLCTAAGLLKSKMEESGVEVAVLSAVSSFDSMINMLNLHEFAAAGVRLIHAGLSGGGISFYPEMDTMVFMMDNLNRVERPEHAGEKEKFINKIVMAYPPGHQILIVNTPFMENRKGRLLRTRVKDLKRDFHRADRNSTLFIPGIKVGF
jgi:precorrin-2 methylase